MIEKKHFPQTSLILLLLIILICLSSLQRNFAYASPATIAKVEPDTISAELGQVFTVNITIMDVLNLYGIEANLFWDPKALVAINVDVCVAEPDGILYAPIFLVADNLTQEQGRYLLAATSVAPAPSFNGTGNIVRITFNVSSLANSKLELETELYDYPPPERWPRLSLPIEHTVLDGSFAAIPEFTNLHVLILYLVTVTMCCVLVQRVRKHVSSASINQTRLITVRFKSKRWDRGK